MKAALSLVESLAFGWFGTRRLEPCRPYRVRGGFPGLADYPGHGDSRRRGLARAFGDVERDPQAVVHLGSTARSLGDHDACLQLAGNLVHARLQALGLERSDGVSA